MPALIDGVRITPLRRIADGRGAVLHMLRADDAHFVAFGEIYFSLVNPGAVKAWRSHLRMAANLAVPVGTVRLVLFDGRPESSTRGALVERLVGEDDYCLVTVPPGVWTGFRAERNGAALVASCLTAPHDPDEIARLDPESPDIPYRWSA